MRPKLWRAKAHKLAESGSKVIRADGIIKVERAIELCSVVVKNLETRKGGAFGKPGESRRRKAIGPDYLISRKPAALIFS